MAKAMGNTALLKAIKDLNLGDPSNIYRVIIDIAADRTVTIYTQAYGTDAVLDIIGSITADNDLKIVKEVRTNG